MPTLTCPSIVEPPAVEHHDRGRDATDELHAGSVHGREPVRPHVRVAVAVVEVVEDLLVLRLAPERVHGLDPAEALHEVHDHERDGVTRGAVCTLGVIAEPTRQ